MTTADAINTALLIVACIGIALTFWQVRTGVRTQRVQFLKDLYSTLVSDNDIKEAYYLIEYSEFNYSHEFHGSSIEPKIDKMLSFVDLVAELHLQAVISNREMAFFRYRFSRIYNNHGIKAYLEFLTEFYKNEGVEKKPFHSFQCVAKEIVEINNNKKCAV